MTTKTIKRFKLLIICTCLLFNTRLNGRIFLRSFWASSKSVALAGGDAARMFLETSNVSSFKGASPANSRYLAVSSKYWFLTSFLLTTNYSTSTIPFSSRNSGVPPSENRITFQSNNNTFFIGKCGADPPQNFMTMFKSLTAKSSSLMGWPKTNTNSLFQQARKMLRSDWSCYLCNKYLIQLWTLFFVPRILQCRHPILFE